MKSILNVVKIGGGLLDKPSLRASCLESFSSLTDPSILVHGGGSRASSLARETGVPVQMVEGRRITDEATLEIAIMVYAGLLNKRLVAELQSRNCHAIGLSGADGDLIRAQKRPVGKIDYGWVGDVQKVSSELLRNLLGTGLSPVLCALTHDGKGQLLNTNADTIATEIALAMTGPFQVKLWFCFEKKGVLKNVENPESLVQELTPKKYALMKNSGQVAAGMIPKLDNAFRALEGGVAFAGIGKAGYFGESPTNFTALTL